jgi:hypothetical protein
MITTMVEWRSTGGSAAVQIEKRGGRWVHGRKKGERHALSVKRIVFYFLFFMNICMQVAIV